MKQVTATNSQLSKFVTNKAKCLAHKCGVPLNEKEGETTVCKHHKAEEPEICVQTIHKVNDMQEHFSRLWTQCQRCQGTTLANVLSVALYSILACIVTFPEFPRLVASRGALHRKGLSHILSPQKGPQRSHRIPKNSRAVFHQLVAGKRNSERTQGDARSALGDARAATAATHTQTDRDTHKLTRSA